MRGEPVPQVVQLRLHDGQGDCVRRAVEPTDVAGQPEELVVHRRGLCGSGELDQGLAQRLGQLVAVAVAVRRGHRLDDPRLHGRSEGRGEVLVVDLQPSRQLWAAAGGELRHAEHERAAGRRHRGERPLQPLQDRGVR